MELEKMRGFSNFRASLAPDTPHRDYVIKILKGERRHDNLTLYDRKSMSALSRLDILSFSQNSIPILEKKESNLKKV